MSHVIQIRYSPNGGRNWSQWRDYDLGETGDYEGRAIYRRLGIFRDMVVEVKDTSAYPANLIAAGIDLA